MYNAYFIQHSFYLHHPPPPPPFVLSPCPSYYYSVAFQGTCAQLLQIYGNRKLLTHIFRRKYDPSQSILLSTYNLEMLRQIFMLADKSTLREAMLSFEMKILPFSGILSEVRSIVEITKGVQSKILDHKFLKLWTYPSPPPPLSLSLSLHAGADTQALFTQCLPVECIVFSFFLFTHTDTHWSLSTQ